MIRETAGRVRSGAASASGLLKEFEPRIIEGQRKYNPYITILLERARGRAAEIDAVVSAGGDPGPLSGIPFAIKDNMLYKDAPMTCGSKILENYISPYTATAVTLLEKAGAVIVAKTNMDEFAMGSSGETSAFGPTRNPRDPERIPGGSSSGSAAAVADGEVMGALGSDTGGSIRQPAAMCGVVGMKPTYGLVSRYGVTAFASSLDQVGPIASCVEDAALILQAIAGHDPLDSTSLRADIPDYTQGLEDGVSGLTFGIPDEYMAEGLDPGIREKIEKTAGVLKESGAHIKRISLPHTEYAVSVYYIVAPAEASANLARIDGVRYGYRTPDPRDIEESYARTRMEGFGPEVKRRIMLGTYALSSGYYDAYYLKAQKVRNLIKRDFDKAFGEVDLILAPTTPSPATLLGEIQDLLQMYLMDIFTISSNLAGIPGISVPMDPGPGGLPVSAQILGPHLSEKLLIRAARQIEKSRG